MYEPCPYCNGRGRVKTSMSMSVEIQRELHAVMRKYQDTVHDIRVTVNPHVLQRLREQDEDLLIEIERKYAGRLTFHAPILRSTTSNMPSRMRTRTRN